MNGTARLYLQDRASTLKRTSSRYNGRVDIVLAVGLGIGLASVAGLRAFLPLLVMCLLVAFGLFELSAAFPQVFGGGDGRGVYVAGALAVLAVAEIVLDKVKSVERFFNIGMVPVRALSGALLFVGTLLPGMANLMLWFVLGAVIAGAVAVLKVVLRPPAGVTSSGVSTSFLSFMEDLVGLIGGAIAFFVPLLPAVLAAFLLFFYARIRKRRGRKFGGLRILGD
jgi:hypothetical protein